MICPLGVTEVGRAADKSICPNWLPRGVGKIYRRFYHDGQIAGAGYVETELVRLHSEEAITGLHLWIPEYGWYRAKYLAPK